MVTTVIHRHGWVACLLGTVVHWLGGAYCSHHTADILVILARFRFTLIDIGRFCP